MIRLRPTAISLSSSEIESHLQQAMLRHTIVTDFENLDVGCRYEDAYGDRRNPQNPSKNCREAPRMDGLDLSQAGGTPSLFDDPLDSGSFFSHTVTENSPSFLKFSVEKLSYQPPECESRSSRGRDTMSPTGPPPSTAPDTHDVAQKESLLKVVHNNATSSMPSLTHVEDSDISSDSDGETTAAERYQRKKKKLQLPEPSLLSECPTSGVDTSLPRHPFSVSYFPTTYERTKLIENTDHDIQADRDVPGSTIPPQIQASPDFLFLGGKRAEPASNTTKSQEKNDESHENSPHTPTNWNETPLPSPPQSPFSDPDWGYIGPVIRQCILKASYDFTEKYNELIAQLDNDDDMFNLNGNNDYYDENGDKRHNNNDNNDNDNADDNYLGGVDENEW